MACRLRQAWRQKHFAVQLPDALGVITSSLRVGHGLQRALQVVANQGEAPLSNEFRRSLSEIAVGVQVDVALQRVADRVRNKEMDLLATVIGIQMQIGGNLAEILDRVADAIREREELQNEVKALTAEGRMTAMVCIGLPPLMGALVAWMNPEYMEPLFKTQIGHAMLIATAVLQTFGAIVIKHMMRLDD